MTTKPSSCTWLVRNILNAAILLPEPPLEPSNLEVLPIGGTAVVGERLLSSLETMVEILSDGFSYDSSILSGASEAECIDEKQKTSSKQERKISDDDIVAANNGCVNDMTLHDFLTAWRKEFADRPVRPSVLKSMVSDLCPQLLDGYPMSSHRSSIALGHHLRYLSYQDLGSWKILIIAGTKKTRYALASTTTSI